VSSSKNGNTQAGGKVTQKQGTAQCLNGRGAAGAASSNRYPWHGALNYRANFPPERGYVRWRVWAH